MLRSPRKVSKTSNVDISSTSALITSIAAESEAFLAIFAFTLPITKIWNFLLTQIWVLIKIKCELNRLSKKIKLIG